MLSRDLLLLIRFGRWALCCYADRPPGTCQPVLRDCLKRLWSWATAPERESRRQPVCGRNRLKPGRLGRCPVSQGTPHAVGPTRIIFSDSL